MIPEPKSPVAATINELTDDQLRNVTGGAPSKDDSPRETITFNYGAIVWTYTQQKP